MARRNLFACVFLLAVVIFSHEAIISADARHLKSKDVSRDVPTVVRPLETAAPAIPAETFRPTSPGHSPGIGHALKNNDNRRV
ncbi:hypothetical protein ACLOJK_016482 [Asimina triloba]